MSKPSKSLHSLIQSSKPCDYWNLILRLETRFFCDIKIGVLTAQHGQHTNLHFPAPFFRPRISFKSIKTQPFLRLRLSAEEVALTKHGQHVSFCWTIIVMTKNKVFLILVENRGNQKIHYFPCKVELHVFSWHGCLPKGPWSIVKNHKRLNKNNTDKSSPLSHIKHVHIYNANDLKKTLFNLENLRLR